MPEALPWFDRKLSACALGDGVPCFAGVSPIGNTYARRGGAAECFCLSISPGCSALGRKCLDGSLGAVCGRALPVLSTAPFYFPVRSFVCKRAGGKSSILLDTYILLVTNPCTLPNMQARFSRPCAGDRGYVTKSYFAHNCLRNGLAALAPCGLWPLRSQLGFSLSFTRAVGWPLHGRFLLVVVVCFFDRLAFSVVRSGAAAVLWLLLGYWVRSSGAASLVRREADGPE
jgi:hypothetical protein